MCRRNWRKGGGGNLKPNARGLTDQVKGCPHRAAGDLCRDGLYAEEMFFSIIALYAIHDFEYFGNAIHDLNIFRKPSTKLFLKI
jgi:hypothetical protein